MLARVLRDRRPNPRSLVDMKQHSGDQGRRNASFEAQDNPEDSKGATIVGKTALLIHIARCSLCSRLRSRVHGRGGVAAPVNPDAAPVGRRERSLEQKSEMQCESKSELKSTTDVQDASSLDEEHVTPAPAQSSSLPEVKLDPKLYTVAVLREALLKRGLSTAGLKGELLIRLEVAMREEQAKADRERDSFIDIEEEVTSDTGSQKPHTGTLCDEEQHREDQLPRTNTLVQPGLLDTPLVAEVAEEQCITTTSTIADKENTDRSNSDGKARQLRERITNLKRSATAGQGSSSASETGPERQDRKRPSSEAAAGELPTKSPRVSTSHHASPAAQSQSSDSALQGHQQAAPAPVSDASTAGAWSTGLSAAPQTPPAVVPVRASAGGADAGTATTAMPPSTKAVASATLASATTSTATATGTSTLPTTASAAPAPGTLQHEAEREHAAPAASVKKHPATVRNADQCARKVLRAGPCVRCTLHTPF